MISAVIKICIFHQFTIKETNTCKLVFVCFTFNSHIELMIRRDQKFTFVKFLAVRRALEVIEADMLTFYEKNCAN